MAIFFLCTIYCGQSLVLTTIYSVFLIHICYIRVNFKGFLSNIFSFFVYLKYGNIDIYGLRSFLIVFYLKLW